MIGYETFWKPLIWALPVKRPRCSKPPSSKLNFRLIGRRRRRYFSPKRIKLSFCLCPRFSVGFAPVERWTCFVKAQDAVGYWDEGNPGVSSFQVVICSWQAQAQMRAFMQVHPVAHAFMSDKSMRTQSAHV